jgi:hypothetical protein
MVIENYQIVSAEVVPGKDETLTFEFFKREKPPVTVRLIQGETVKLV